MFIFTLMNHVGSILERIILRAFACIDNSPWCLVGGHLEEEDSIASLV